MVDWAGRHARWLLVGAAGVAITIVVAMSLAPGLPERGYSTFLEAVGAGRVTSVVQTGTQLEVVADDGRYAVLVPSVLTDVYRDVVAASGGTPTVAFEARPTPDAPWLGLGPILVANVVLMSAVLVVAVALLRRRPGSTA